MNWTTMKLDYEDLGLAQQVLKRQGFEHLTRTKEYANQWCSISSSEMGGLFSYFLPLNDLVVSAGTEVLDVLAQAHQYAATAMGNTIDTYAKADEEAWKLLSQLASSIGVFVGDYSDPRDSIPSLGSAANKASRFYGGGDPFLIAQSGRDGAALRNYIHEERQRLEGHIKDFQSSNRSVREEQAPQSFLVAPATPTSEMENLRWSAGVFIGGLDWVFEKLFGWSLLNDFIFKEIIGDWRFVGRAADAWGHIDDALVAVGQNDSGILPALSEWLGKGSEACNAFITALSAATTAASYAAGAAKNIIAKFALAAKMAAIGLGWILKKISYKLARIAAEAAVPVVGWALAVAECAITISEVIGAVRMGYAIANALYDAISSIAEAKAKMIEVLHTCTNIAEAATRGSMARI